MLVSVHKVAPVRVCVPGDAGLPEGRTAWSPFPPSPAQRACRMTAHLGEKGRAPRGQGSGAAATSSRLSGPASGDGRGWETGTFFLFQTANPSLRWDGSLGSSLPWAVDAP